MRVQVGSPKLSDCKLADGLAVVVPLSLGLLLGVPGAAGRGWGGSCFCWGPGVCAVRSQATDHERESLFRSKGASCADSFVSGKQPWAH